MPALERRVEWSRDGSRLVEDVGVLDQLLDNLFATTAPSSPLIAVVDGPNEQSVFLGIGGQLSFVSFCEFPYLTTVGDPAADGEIDYFYQGHHSPIRKRHLIPLDSARLIVREFFLTGTVSSWPTWEEI